VNEFVLGIERSSSWRVNPRLIAMESFAGEIVLGGIFDEIGGVPANNIAAWSGSQWHALDIGLVLDGPYRGSDCVTSLTRFEGMLIAGGLFSRSGAAPRLANIARWDGTRWIGLGEGLDGVPETLAVQAGHLYALGRFNLDDWDPAPERLLRWNGRGWKSVRPLLPRDFYACWIASSPRGLTVTGSIGEGLDPFGFPLSGIQHVGLFDGRRWQPFIEELGSGVIRSVVEFGDKLVAGGYFTSIDDVLANGLAFLDASGWQEAVPGRGLNMRFRARGGLIVIPEATMAAGAFLADGANLIVGGSFDFAGGRHVGGIARWDGDAWHEIGGGTDGGVQALTHWNGLLVAGGGFKYAGGVETHGVATWDGVRWSPLGVGLESQVATLVDFQGSLIAGGYFNYSGSQQIYGVARWDGTAWRPMRFGLYGGVDDLVVYQGELLAGGASRDGRRHLGPVARWDGAEWVPFGTLSGTLDRLRMVGGDLYAIGSLRLTTGGPIHRIVRWDGVVWVPVGEWTDLRIKDVALYEGRLVVATWDVGPTSLRGRLHILRDQHWEPLSRPMNSLPLRLEVFQHSLYCGGDIIEVGDHIESLGIARWDGTATDVALEPAAIAMRRATALEPIGLAGPGEAVHIAFTAGTAGEARVDLYDVSGRKRQTLARMPVTPGRYVLEWHRRDDRRAPLARGVYFVRLQLAGGEHTRKVVVVDRR
jgi:hypothetical protein